MLKIRPLFHFLLTLSVLFDPALARGATPPAFPKRFQSPECFAFEALEEQELLGAHVPIGQTGPQKKSELERQAAGKLPWLIETFKRETLQEINSLVDPIPETFETLLSDLPFAQLRSAHGNRSNLRSPMFQKMFLEPWEQGDRQSALDILIVGFRTELFPEEKTVYLSAIPKQIHEEIPSNLGKQLLRIPLIRSLSSLKNSASLSVLWQYFYISSKQSFWLPVQINKIRQDGSFGKPIYIKFILRPPSLQKPMRIMKIRIKKLLRRFLREQAESLAGPLDPKQMPAQIHEVSPILWVAGRIPEMGVMALTAPHFSLNHQRDETSNLHFHQRASEPYIEGIGPQGVPLTMFFPSIRETQRLQVALEKNDQGQITRLLAAHAEIPPNVHRRISRDHPQGYWLQGLMVHGRSLFISTYKLARRRIPLTNLFTFEASNTILDRLPAEALLAPRPRFVRIWKSFKSAETVESFFTKLIEIRDRAGKTLEVVKSFQRMIPGRQNSSKKQSSMSLAMKRAALIPNDNGVVVVSNLSGFLKEEVLTFSVGRRRIAIPRAVKIAVLGKDTPYPNNLVAQVLYDPKMEGQQKNWPVPTTITLGFMKHRDPNRLMDNPFHPIVTLLVRKKTDRYFEVIDPTPPRQKEPVHLDNSILILRRNSELLQNIVPVLISAGIESIEDLMHYSPARLMNILVSTLSMNKQTAMNRIDTIQDELRESGLSPLPDYPGSVPEKIRNHRFDSTDSMITRMPKAAAHYLFSHDLQTIGELIDVQRQYVYDRIHQFGNQKAQDWLRQEIRKFLKENGLPRIGALFDASRAARAA